MTPPNEARGRSEDQPRTDVNRRQATRPLHGGTYTSLVTDLSTNNPAEVVSKMGDVARHTHRRSITALCSDCGDTFPSTGTAASHARSWRHVVEINYYVGFSFRPVVGE